MPLKGFILLARQILSFNIGRRGLLDMGYHVGKYVGVFGCDIVFFFDSTVEQPDHAMLIVELHTFHTLRPPYG